MLISAEGSPTKIRNAVNPRIARMVLITIFIIRSVVNWFISFISTKIRNVSQTVKNNFNILQVVSVFVLGGSAGGQSKTEP